MQVDVTSAARRADPELARTWLGEQRVFISSAMTDTADERRAVAAAVADEGAQAIWFEEFGRDADPEQAYLVEVDRSTIYVAILNEQYGRLLPSGFSATEAEYLRARKGGKRLAVYSAAPAPAREGHLNRFLDRIRVFVVTETFADAADLASRVRRRLQELAAEALSPWVKLGDLVFRADLIDDWGATVTVSAPLGDQAGHVLDDLAAHPYRHPRVRFAYEDRVVVGELASVRRTVQAGGMSQRTIELARVEPVPLDPMRAGTAGRSADDLVELGMRRLFLGEPLPDALDALGFMTETGIEPAALAECFDLPNEVAPAITRLVVSDGLVGSGRASRIASLSLGPAAAGERTIQIEWVDPRLNANAGPERRSLQGQWARSH
jgi:hypothetical protein